MSIQEKLPNGWSVYDRSDGKMWYRNNIFNFITQQKPKTEQLLPGDWIVVDSKTKNIPYFYNKKTKKSSWSVPLSELKECYIKGLLWVGQSCYMDSILVALFSNPSPITKALLNNPVTRIAGKFRCGNSLEQDINNRKLIQEELIRISDMVKGSEGPQFCTDLRATLRNCPSSERWYHHVMSDSGEFLAFILSLFNIPQATTTTVTYGTNNKEKNPPNNQLIETSKIVNNKNSPIIWIYNHSLQEGKTRISNHLNMIEDNYPHFFTKDQLFTSTNAKGQITGLYERRINIVSYTDAPALIFNIERLFENTLYKNIVLIEPEIILGIDKIFVASAIVLYVGAHYTCALRCINKWYLYNDVSYGTHGMQYLGDFEEMLVKTNASKIATQVFYVPKEVHHTSEHISLDRDLTHIYGPDEDSYQIDLYKEEEEEDEEEEEEDEEEEEEEDEEEDEEEEEDGEEQAILLQTEQAWIDDFLLNIVDFDLDKYKIKSSNPEYSLQNIMENEMITESKKYESIYGNPFPSIKNGKHRDISELTDIIEEHLRMNGFTDDEIQELY